MVAPSGGYRVVRTSAQAWSAYGGAAVAMHERCRCQRRNEEPVRSGMEIQEIRSVQSNLLSVTPPVCRGTVAGRDDILCRKCLSQFAPASRRSRHGGMFRSQPESTSREDGNGAGNRIRQRATGAPCNKINAVVRLQMERTVQRTAGACLSQTVIQEYAFTAGVPGWSPHRQAACTVSLTMRHYVVARA